jgi:N-acetylglucosamine repressor
MMRAGREPQGTNAKLVKVHNRALVLRIIQQREMISRKDIAALTGLSPAAITLITNSLLEQSLIVETGTGSVPGASGRKPIFLSINKERRKILTVSVGRGLTQGAVCDLSGRIITRTVENRSLISGNHLAVRDPGAEILSFLNKIMREEQVGVDQVLGVSIAAPGPLNAREGTRSGVDRSEGGGDAAPFDWRDVHVRDYVEDALGVNVFVDNDANISALGESWFGAGLGVPNFVLYAVGLGTGAGVIIDGMLYRGDADVVAEIGHVTIDRNGERCPCGNIGCLELYAGFSRMLRRAGRVPESPEALMEGIRGVFRAAEAGDEAARSALAEQGGILGIGAVTLANIFSPELIIVSGNDLGDLDLTPVIAEMQESVRRRAFSVAADSVQVVPSVLGRDITLYGGIALVLQDFFASPADD